MLNPQGPSVRSWPAVIRTWLTDIDIPDPVDRRNAPVLQLLLLLIGLIASFNPVLFLVTSLLDHRQIPAEKILVVIAMLIVGAVSWISFLTIRAGRLRLAVKIFVAALLIALTIIYSRIGVQYLTNEPLALLPLGIAGLVLGRQALWSVFASLTAICVISIGMELVRIAAPGSSDAVPLAGMGLNAVGTFLLIALVLDRTVTALRESLAESNSHRRELADALSRLHTEMAERERAQARLVHAQKMEVTGRLASGIAHDFGNIISIIAGFASRRHVLADRGVDALVNALKNIEMASQRADIISRRLLNFSRRQDTSATRFDAGGMLLELKPMIRQLFPSRVDIAVDAESRPALVYLDRAQFELAIFNIASNARDALVGEGLFTILCRCSADGETVQIELADTGLGIPPAVLPHIFDAFYTTKPIGQGTGLGLSITRDMIEQAGGSIRAESTPGAGTRFLITLPAQQAETECRKTQH
ncbi:sensor histidine kinase [Pseudoxanthomonas winnipegensis]|uniref:histidine kinase n=1 Tax=Pseudoxanthomonas winnipegensis TaxID=2480810 RepID=A0A4Q8M254_9GAMM|nr:ATP-binding protein [Pseudoxanthomonas winnipegensis]TAA38815.1 hypothetical protein EA655_15565 [Pseudoxanthomonas winnipegensis]